MCYPCKAWERRQDPSPSRSRRAEGREESCRLRDLTDAENFVGLERLDVVGSYDGLQAKVDELKRLQAESAAELDALLPAILDRAFKGEL